MISAASPTVSSSREGDSRSPPSFQDLPSCSNYRLRATRSFLFPIVPGGIIERRERGNPSRNNRAARCFLPLSVHAARLIYFIGFRPGYQSSKSNNIISLRLPVRGPIPFPFEPGEIPRSEFMADSVATTLYTKVCKGLILTRVHISIAMT